MARDFGVIPHEIWRDSSFTCLSRDAQWLYLMVLTCQEMNWAGVMPLDPEKWAGLSADNSIPRVWDAIEAVTEHGHLGVDRDTRELLCPGIPRLDGSTKSPMLLVRVYRDAMTIRSDFLREFVLEGLPPIPEGFTFLGEEDLKQLRYKARPSPQDVAIVMARADGRCESCGWSPGMPVVRAASRPQWKPEARWRLEIDHIFPVSRGGTGDIANLQVLCTGCNTRKWAHV